jgi:hypothetical protein
MTSSSFAQRNEDDPHRLAMAGHRLTGSEARNLEDSLSKNPSDLSMRTKLLGYYEMQRYSSKAAKKARQEHVLWIIKNRPEAPVAGLPYCALDPSLDGDVYKEGKRLWLLHTKSQSQNTVVLGNAAAFCVLYDRNIAEELLRRAQSLEPSNPDWSKRLGHLYALAGKGKANAAKSLIEFERAYSAEASASAKFYLLDDMAKQGFEAGEIEKASRYSNELLQAAQNNTRDWNYGNAVHHGNIVLGRIALKRGDKQKAIEHLLAAGKTPGSPQLDSFGPNMSLAKELLAEAERDAVLQYFKLCATFWKRDELKGWTKVVKAGEIPDFGANLVY